MININFKQIFDPLETVMFDMVKERYLLNLSIEQSDVTDIRNFIKQMSTIELGKPLNAIMVFCYSYHYLFEEKIPLNKYIEDNHAQLGYGTPKSASSGMYKWKETMLKDNYLLCNYFSDTYDGLALQKSGTLSKIDAEVIVKSVRYYNMNPYKVLGEYLKNPQTLKPYTIKDAKEFIAGFDLNNNVNAYLFERIYHLNLALEILRFYYEISEFIKGLHMKDNVLVYNEYKKYEYFDAQKLKQNLFKYMLLIRKDLQFVKKQYMEKCRWLAINLCKIALIEDVYTQSKVLKMCIDGCLDKIINEYDALRFINETVAYNMRKNIICIDAFYYGTIQASILKPMQKETIDKNFIWKILSYQYEKADGQFLKETMDVLDEYINSDDFNINTSFDGINDEENMLSTILSEILFSVDVIGKNYDLRKKGIFDDSYRKEHRKIFNEQMHRELKYEVCSFVGLEGEGFYSKLSD